MTEWTDGSLINEEAIAKLTPEQLRKLAEILEDI
tara:strand:+ start:324 stop:425 length:102 start_codon:yes stop_codon:yes gene_type:complete